MIKSLALLCLLMAVVSGVDFCWRDSYGRGVGAPLHVCAPGLEKNGLLCYPPCKSGYYGVGPVCWAHCPSDMKDTGAQCQKDSYGRGVGKPLHTCKGNQDQNGALCYDKCKDKMYGVGPVCWSRCDDGYTDDGALCRRNTHIYGKGCCCTIFGCCHNCNKGYTDDGCTCRKDVHIYAKKSSGRGAGYPMSCTADQDSNAGLCYKRCNSGFVGVGPVCWAGCPAGWTDCGAGCAPDKHGCGDKIIDMVTQTGMAVATTVGMVVGAGEAGKAAQTVAKVAKYAAKSTKFAAKIAKYGNDIFNSAKAKGQPITQAQASDLASQTVGQFIAGVGEKGQEGWEAAFDAIAQVDPTGIMAATKTFINPLCSQIH